MTPPDDNTPSGGPPADAGTDAPEESPAGSESYHKETLRGPSDPPTPPAYKPADSLSADERETFDFEAQNLDALTVAREGVITYLGREWHIREPQTVEDTMSIFMAVTDDGSGDAVLIRRLIAICITDPERERPSFEDMTPFQIATLGAAVADWLELQELIDELGSLPAVRRRAAEALSEYR